MIKLENLTDEQWAQVYKAKQEWLDHGLSTDPADRPTSETAITEMYRLIGKPEPQFIWVDSPGSAALAIWLLSTTEKSQLGGQLWGQLGGQLRGQLWGQLGGQLGDQLGGQLGGQLWGQLGGQLGDQLGGQLRGQLGGQLWGQLGGQLGGQLWDQLRGQLRGQLWGQLGGQLWGQLGGQLGGQLRGQLGDQLRGQLWGQLGGQLGDQLGGQLWDQLGGQLGDQLGGQLGGQLRDQLWDQLRSSVFNGAFWGQHDAYWVAHYLVPYELGFGTYEEEQVRRLNLWADLSRSCGWWWPFEGMCIMAERPRQVCMEPWPGREIARLHCPDGPAIEFRDGWALHSWHGTRVPADLIEGKWDTQRILTEPNSEVRRCAIEHRGWDRFIVEAGLQQVGDTVPDPGNDGQTISLYDVPEAIYDEPVRVLLCTNGTPERDGTRRRFGLTVPAEIDEPIVAAAWTFNLPVEAYRRLEVRR